MEDKMISNIHRNCMGTTSFDAKFPGMRKAQDFIVYPMHSGNDATKAMIQSDTRIGFIHMESGTITLSKPRAGGAYGVHLNGAQVVGRLSSENLLMLKAEIFGSAHGNAGTNGIVYTDNSAAVDVFANVS
jgi:hypothetical protein